MKLDVGENVTFRLGDGYRVTNKLQAIKVERDHVADRERSYSAASVGQNVTIISRGGKGT